MSKNLKLVTDTGGAGEIHLDRFRDGNYYIYCENNRIKNSLVDSMYKPIKCSDLYYKINKVCKWFQYKYPVVKDDNIYLVTKNIPSENRLKPIYEINPENLKKELMTETDTFIKEVWENFEKVIGDSKEIIDKMINLNEIYLLNNSKSTVDFLSNNTIVTELINSNSYSNTVDIKSILGNKLFKNKTLKLDLSIKYSIGSEIYVYDTTVSGIKIDNETGKIQFNNFIQTLEKIRIEFLGGIIKVFPTNENIVDCIISNCLITYGGE